MRKSGKKLPPSKRLALYRARAARAGMRRVEVAVPAADVGCIRGIAHVLRQGGTIASRLRYQAQEANRPKIAKTGAELIALSRANIGKGVDIEFPPREYEEPREIEW